MKNNLTLTLKETAELCKSFGWQVDVSILADGISSGRYPFGKVISTGKTKRRTFEIWRADVLAFLQEKGAAV